jgi:hypothetical protein
MMIAAAMVPAVESAFALVRQSKAGGKSMAAGTRFAWNLAASRMELIDSTTFQVAKPVRHRAVSSGMTACVEAENRDIVPPTCF